MLFFKIVYLIVLIVSSAFFILYKDMLALILLCSLIVVPLALFLSVLIMRLTVKFDVRCKSGVITKGQKEIFVVEVINKSPFPITKILLNCMYRNSFFDEGNKDELYFWAKPFSSNSYEMEILSEHVGNVTVKFESAYVHDYFSIFSLPFRVNKEFSYSVIPEVQPLDISLTSNIYSMTESNVFSKHKPGDDPSEIFQIRDYIDGDKLNKIHWKLSSKQESFIVKDYSLPINESVLLLIEMCDSQKNYNLLDTQFEVLFSLSHMFIERETVHSIGWCNAESGSFYSMAIESIDDLFTAMGMLYANGKFYDEPYVAGLDGEHLQGFSHAFYIASNINSRHCDLIGSNGNNSCIFNLIDVLEEGNQSQAIGSDNSEIIPVTEGKVLDCLSGY